MTNIHYPVTEAQIYFEKTLYNFRVTVFGWDKKYHKNGRLYKNYELSKVYSLQKENDAKQYYLKLKKLYDTSGNVGFGDD